MRRNMMTAADILTVCAAAETLPLMQMHTSPSQNKDQGLSEGVALNHITVYWQHRNTQPSVTL